MNKRNQVFKSGKVAIVGRPNSGKSTLLNNLIGQKVAIVSDKPQTTQSRITAVYESERGQIFFRDTPGLFASSLGLSRSRKIIEDTIQDADIIVYVIDHTRPYGREEKEIQDLLFSSKKPFILVFNKIDRTNPSYKEQYKVHISKTPLAIIEVSALKNKKVHEILDVLFKTLPEGTRDELVDEYESPLLSQHSNEYIEELIREKIFLLTRQEIPYQATPYVTSIEENEAGTKVSIKAIIEMTEEKYKGFIIGKNGSKIQEIRKAVQKELELITNKDVLISLKVTS